MKTKISLALVLCLALLFSSCSGGTSEPAEETVIRAAAGRYLERETGFPALDSIISFERLENGDYYAVGSMNGYEPPFSVWRSTDGGETWQQEDYPALADLQILSAAYAGDKGFCVVYLSDYSDEENLEFGAAFAKGDSLEVIEDCPALADFNTDIRMVDGETVLMNDQFSMTCVNLATGCTVEYPVEGMAWPGSYVVYDGVLAISEKEYIAQFDLETGDALGKIPYAKGRDSDSTGFRYLAVQDNRSAFFYADNGGLFRVTADGSITEQLIDGALASFSLPTTSIQALFHEEDGSFLLLCHSGDAFQLQRYVYDETASREPSRQMSLYALREDRFLRQVAGLYHLDNPDMMVRVDIGMEENGAMTVDDALRALSTELLAGNGPDLLMLDGLPVDSYIRHGVLLELGGPLADVQDDLLPHAVDRFRRDGSLYAVPTQVTAPVLAGIDVEEISSLRDFVDYVERQEQKRPGVDAESVMEQFYDICVPRWFTAEGGVDAAVVAEDLTQLERLVRIGEALPYNYQISGLLGQSMWWGGDGLAAICSSLESLHDIAGVYTALEQKGAGNLRLFPGEVVAPHTVLGINAASPQVADAEDFLRFALSPEIQQNTLSDGLPASRPGLEAMLTGETAGEVLFSGSQGYNDGSGEHYSMSAKWPEEDKVREVMALIEAARTPSYTNEIIRQMIMEETGQFFSGGRPLEETVEALSQQVQRYLQEQGN